MQTINFLKKHLLIIVLTLTTGIMSAQNANFQEAYKGCGKKGLHTKSTLTQTPLLNNYDVKFYHLDIAVERISVYVEGNVTIMAEVVSSVLDTFAFELIDILTIDSVLINGVNSTFTRGNNEVFVKIISPINQGNVVTAKIYYKGTPPTGGFFSGISNATSQTWGNQITWTLSEAFNANQWFPCKQVLTDKADSSYVYVTTSSSNKVGSNGLLENVVTLPNNKTRYEWKSRHPIVYYLISIAVGEYIDYSFYAHPAGLNDSILVQNYIYNNPATLNNFKTQIDLTDDFIELYSDLFGLYPFWKEKYGHCMAPLGGGMEHQTMTTLGSFNFLLTSHELSHQWFGDNVTCATWSDIWINEGFASYCEYLALENLVSGQEIAWMADVHDNVLSQPDGSVYIPFSQADDEMRIFDSRLSYDKGAAIINTLRFELQNDTTFFDLLKAFQVQYKDSVATGDDFKVLAENMSGKNFTDFFNQWYYGEGYPIYNILWLQFDDTLFISNVQTTSTTITPLFKMLLPFKIHTANGDTVVLLQQNQLIENFKVPFSTAIDNIELDPDYRVLKVIDNIIQGSNIEINKSETFLVYPSPASDDINIQFGDSKNRQIQIFNITGGLVFETELTQSLFRIDIKSFNKGVYQVKVKGNDGLYQTKRFVKF